MKKIIITLLLIWTFLIPATIFASCTYTDWADVWMSLDKCLNNSDLVNWKSVKVEAWGGFQNQIQTWTKNIALYLWVFAVWSIVLWGLMLTLSAWEEEKIKKAKDIVKWGIIWFLWIITASAIISIIVRIIYSI
jgi:hypothetical protein